MIQVNISEMKNRLSYYLRLVRGGEQIEIIDRKTPLARLVHISQAESENSKAVWIKEMEQLGIVTPPKKRSCRPSFLTRLSDKREISKGTNVTPAVLEALLEEREAGR